ncbi:MAG: SDR family oxidoreductase [Alphaproteobacteria bacterium]|nr:SDR family oxidoreductase [Alphaproteobacteria bacterium]
MSLDGQKVFVIGGSSGIGLETARLAQDAGAQVTIASRSEEKLAAAQAEIGGQVATTRIDVLDDDSVKAAFAATGTVDHVVFTPPGGTVGKIREIDTDAVLQGLDAKIVAAVRTAKYADISERGSLTFITGQFARRPLPGMLMGAAVNAAIDVLGRGLAVEYAPIRVNMISPGVIDTPLHARLPDEMREGMFKNAASRLPVGRVGTPDEIGMMAVQVMENGFLTGAIIEIDGGANVLV